MLYFPSANERTEVGVRKRVLCRYKFMNSKTLFKEVISLIPLVSPLSLVLLTSYAVMLPTIRMASHGRSKIRE